MEGLPVRQWRKRAGVVNAVPVKVAPTLSKYRDTIWHELQMPRGSELYPPHSQALLRQARMLKLPSPQAEDEKEAEEEEAEGEAEEALLATRWTQLPREQEQPEVEFLAKRRKGLPSAYGARAGKAGTMKKTKVKRIDGEGNSYFLDVLVPEDVPVDGETGEELLTEAADLAIVEGAGLANSEGAALAVGKLVSTPTRRKGPLPKRKHKGPGRGRKKKVVEAPSNEENVTAEPSPTGGDTDAKADTELKPQPAGEPAGEDIEMRDVQDREVQDKEEDSEGEDEDVEEADNDVEDGELPPPRNRPVLQSLSSQTAIATLPDLPPTTTAAAGIDSAASMDRDNSSSPDIPLAAEPSLATYPSGNADEKPVGASSHATDRVKPSKVRSSATAGSAVTASSSADKLAPMPAGPVAIPAPDIRSSSALVAAATSVRSLTVEGSAAERTAEPSAMQDVIMPQRQDRALVFEDGEEDLLGSLEKHLNAKS